MLRPQYEVEDKPIDSVSRVPERLFHKVNAEDEYQRSNDHHGCIADGIQHGVSRSTSDEIYARMYAIGPLPTNSSTAVAAASMNPAVRVSPPTR